MNFSVPTKDKSRILDTLGKANKAFQAIYPGDRPERQPVHTVYGGADLFRADTAQKMANAALKTLLENAADFTEFARAGTARPRKTTEEGSRHHQAREAF